MKYKFKITLKFLNGEIFMEDVTETDNDEDYESARKLVNKKTDPKLFDYDMENIGLKEAT